MSIWIRIDEFTFHFDTMMKEINPTFGFLTLLVSCFSCNRENEINKQKERSVHTLIAFVIEHIIRIIDDSGGPERRLGWFRRTKMCLLFFFIAYNKDFYYIQDVWITSDDNVFDGYFASVEWFHIQLIR